MAFVVEPALVGRPTKSKWSNSGSAGAGSVPSQGVWEPVPQAHPCPSFVGSRSKPSWQNALILLLGQKRIQILPAALASLFWAQVSQPGRAPTGAETSLSFLSFSLSCVLQRRFKTEKPDTTRLSMWPL